ncbi:hypothetical protein D3C86_1314830 [compost metagenome]
MKARTSPIPVSTSRISSAAPLRRRRTRSSTSFPTSNSRTSTGSVMTGSTTKRTRPISRPNMVMTSACPSTGRPMRILPNSSPAAMSMARRSLAIWTMARRTRRSAGASPMPGFPWPATATRACQTVCRSMNGASRSTTSRSRSVPAWRAAAIPMVRLPSIPSRNISNG